MTTRYRVDLAAVAEAQGWPLAANIASRLRQFIDAMGRPNHDFTAVLGEKYEPSEAEEPWRQLADLVASLLGMVGIVVGGVWLEPVAEDTPVLDMALADRELAQAIADHALQAQESGRLVGALVQAGNGDMVRVTRVVVRHGGCAVMGYRLSDSEDVLIGCARVGDLAVCEESGLLALGQDQDQPS